MLGTRWPNQNQRSTQLNMWNAWNGRSCSLFMIFIRKRSIQNDNVSVAVLRVWPTEYTIPKQSNNWNGHNGWVTNLNWMKSYLFAPYLHDQERVKKRETKYKTRLLSMLLLKKIGMQLNGMMTNTFVERNLNAFMRFTCNANWAYKLFWAISMRQLIRLSDSKD